MKHDYEFVGLKDTDVAEGSADSISFAVIVNNNPKYEGKVFIYENLYVLESTDGQAQISVGLVMLDGDKRLMRADMPQEDQDFMVEVLMQISEETMGEEVIATTGDE